MKTQCILLMPVLAALVGCSNPKDDHNGQVYMRSLVPKYYSAEGIEVKLYRIVDEMEPYLIRMYISISAVDIGGSYTYNSIGEEKAKYDAICAKNGDLEFNRYVDIGYSANLWGEAGFFDTNFTAISITANEDYDENHPAGTELNDLCGVSFYSAYPYIKNGYDMSNMGNIVILYVTPMQVPASLAEADFKILGNGQTYELMQLKLGGFGTHFSKDVALTVTLTADDERVFSDTVTVTWE